MKKEEKINDILFEKLAQRYLKDKDDAEKEKLIRFIKYTMIN